MQPSSVKAFNRFLERSLESAGTPDAQKEAFTYVYNLLQLKYPDKDNYWLNHWTSRILFFTDWQTDHFELTMDESQDPGIITLTFYPDYGS